MSSKNTETRNRILKASLGLLEASQGKDVRMSDIAKLAGISRQALYLHFSTRAELLIATTLYLDEIKGTDDRLTSSRTAETGQQRLDAYIDAWGHYIPEIYGIAKALLAMRDTDDAAAEAWDNRMQAMKEGCKAAIEALSRDNMLSPDHPPEDATDLLWTLLSIRNWEQLTLDCGWSQEKYIDRMKALARRNFVKDE
ncbi:MAG: TetR/AcrR family transcriptional regulator [Sneathiella sp.]|nr:TetR/AcrR family transcriptional regulator [Sneathiella sp.]